MLSEADLPLSARKVYASVNLQRKKKKTTNLSSFLVPGTRNRACCSCWSSCGSPSYLITILCTEGRPVQLISCLTAGIKGGEKERQRKRELARRERKSDSPSSVGHLEAAGANCRRLREAPISSSPSPAKTKLHH